MKRPSAPAAWKEFVRVYVIQADGSALLQVWVRSHRRNADAPLHRQPVYSLVAEPT